MVKISQLCMYLRKVWSVQDGTTSLDALIKEQEATKRENEELLEVISACMDEKEKLEEDVETLEESSDQDKQMITHLEESLARKDEFIEHQREYRRQQMWELQELQNKIAEWENYKMDAEQFIMFLWFKVGAAALRETQLSELANIREEWSPRLVEASIGPGLGMATWDWDDLEYNLTAAMGEPSFSDTEAANVAQGGANITQEGANVTEEGANEIVEVETYLQ